MSVRLAALIPLLLGLPASAQIDRSGPRVAGHLITSGLTIDFGELSETATGIGIGAEAGYGFTPSLSLNVSASGSSLRLPNGATYGFQSASIGARYNVLPSAAFTPYIAAGGTLLRAEFDLVGTPDNQVANGAGAFGSVGVEYELSSIFSADARLTGYTGRFTDSTQGDVTADLDLDFTSLRLGAGVTATF